MARAASDAVAVEADDVPEGSTVHLEVDGATVVVAVHATTLSSLRAALNGTLRLLDAAVGVVGD